VYTYQVCEIAGFHCAVLGYYEASNGNFIPTFRANQPLKMGPTCDVITQRSTALIYRIFQCIGYLKRWSSISLWSIFNLNRVRFWIVTELCLLETQNNVNIWPKKMNTLSVKFDTCASAEISVEYLRHSPVFQGRVACNATSLWELKHP
jgi:hypothetical protein